MEITTNPLTDPHHVRITSDASGGAVALDGVDLSRLVQGYTLHQMAGQPAQLILEFAPGRPVTEYEGLARVAVASPTSRARLPNASWQPSTSRSWSRQPCTAWT
ncbi:hypothetical protein ADK96_27365 [Streptomyces sp. IGB124]|nr:hypothetical protein ADK96_27365 [Streptomyces sp. IGB124]